MSRCQNLNLIEKQRFDQLEAAIDDGMPKLDRYLKVIEELGSTYDAAVKTWQALLEIRDRKLYRQRFSRFEDYIKARYMKSDRWWQLLNKHLELCANRTTVRLNDLPERTTREFTQSGLPVETFDEVLHRAQELSGGVQPSAAQMKEAVEEVQIERINNANATAIAESEAEVEEERVALRDKLLGKIATICARLREMGEGEALRDALREQMEML